MRQTKQTDKEVGTGRRSEPQIRLVLGMTSGASFFRHRPAKEDLN